MTLLADAAIPLFDVQQPLLGPPAFAADAPILDLCAGPGGWEAGARILGLAEPILGIEIHPEACATARAAGFWREQGDITAYDPRLFPKVKGLITSTPCQTMTAGGKRSGLGLDYQTVCDVITHHGASVATWFEEHNAYGRGCNCTWQDIKDELNVIADVRTRLAAQTIRWALDLPNLEWLVMEQVPAAEFMFEDIAAELYAAGWESVDVVVLDAADYGVASHRKRVFLLGRRFTPIAGSCGASRWIEPVTMAQALGWEPGHLINTRGERKTSGGNHFSADKVSWCLTGKARCWYRLADRRQLTAAEAGVLNGFRPDHPWTGSRTSQFQQVADVVAPPMGAVILGTVLGLDWVTPLREHLFAIYGKDGA